jgi:murein DD-endopeptidase MepM/ murein hydrolase activator NlpD
MKPVQVAATATEAGLPDVGPLFEPTPPPQVYVIEPGDTLSSIARRFGCTTEDLIKTNQIANPNLLSVGQTLKLPSIDAMTGPDLQLLPNSEFVNGPAYVDFDTAAFVAKSGGYLNSYSEYVGGELLSGPEIVNLVAHHFSVGPRLLLALIELQTGWVTNPNPGGQAFSHRWLSRAADDLNKGYYDWRGRGVTLLKWADGSATRYAPTLNAATAGLQYYFSRNVSKGPWQVLVGDEPGSFLETYRNLFGDPAQYAIEPLIPATTTVPDLSLPWSVGELWFYTGGPHGAWGDGSAWAAIDAVPDEGYLGCRPGSAWATAAAPGLVIHSEDGEVLVDLDGDGHGETGWVLFYLHVGTEGRVPAGTQVERGDPIGHPSCEGGFTESSHLHFARKFNGEWIAADGPLPMILSGWQFHSSDQVYEGTATRGNEERTAWECRDAEFCGIVAD